MLKKVSPRSVGLKSWVKAPLLFLIFTTACQSGLTIAFTKLTTELAESHVMWDNMGLVVILILVIIVSGMTQVHTLNLAIKYYEQVLVIPIFQATVMTMWIASGMIIFDEISLYTSK